MVLIDTNEAGEYPPIESGSTKMPPIVTISNHTTSSAPRPHIRYTVEVTRNGTHTTVARRYSEFVSLNDTLQVTNYALPPKRILVTTFVPSAWIDDHLIAERKAGLQEYLTGLIQDPAYSDHPVLRDFLLKSDVDPLRFNPEDAVPSTFSRKAALALVKGGLVGKSQAAVAATPIAAAYYPDWSAGNNPPENLDYSKFDILFFAFATPNSASTLDYGGGSQDILRRLVSSARNSGRGTKVILSVGGWGGSYWFSQATSNADNRRTFSNALAGAITNFGLDGVDLDWEYPNSNGAGNPHSASDADNFLRLLQSLRQTIGSSKIISSAVPHRPWIGSNGSPLSDVSAFASVMDYVNIMNYDVWGASSNPGPNAPLGDLCGTSGHPEATAHAALKQWTAAGFPASKLLLGLPLYGYVSNSTATRLSGSLLPTSEGEGEEMNFLEGAHPHSASKDTVHAAADLRGWYGQQIPFNAIVSSGALVKNADGNFGGGGGFTMGWDNCSDTPYLFNVSQSTVVTYDDTWSLATKTRFAKDSGMAGCFTWSLDQDEGVTLQNIIRANLGK